MASSFYTTLEKTLQCPVCKQTFLDPHIPKQLPHCSHVCCQPCLEQIAKPHQDICELTCPECRTLAYVPKGRIGDLMTNVHLLNLAEAHRTHSLQKQKKQQQTVLAQEATKKIAKLIIKKDDEDYVEMLGDVVAKPIYQEPQQISTAPPLITHSYLKPDRPVNRPLPEIPGDIHPKPPPSPVVKSPKPPPSPVVKSSSDKKQPPSVPVKNKRCSKEAANLTDDDLIEMSSFGQFDQVQAIICTPDGLIAACDFSDSTVKIFERKQGKYKQAFKLKLYDKNPRKPADVAILRTTSTDKTSTLTKSKPTYRFLVARHIGVEAYTADGKYEQTIQPCKTDGICSVTTTENRHILMGDIKRFVVTEHDNDGALIRTVKVKTKPARIEALSNSLVAISHFRSGKIELVDMATETSVLTIDIPEALGMHYLKKSDTLLVVNSKMSNTPGSIYFNTGTVTKICCQTGQVIGQIIKGLYHPFDLTVTHDGLLAIADEKTILVYRSNSQNVVLYES